jgi:tripartite-type tricarboxylate transporter receptor subunit TctC
MTCRFVLAAVLAVFGAAAGAAGQAAPTNLAQAYPARPIRILVLNTPGSGTDIVSRLVANKLTQAWGQQVVVDNRAGASGNIGAEIGARAAPDGYTLVMITSQQPIVVAMFGKLNYDLVKDFSPISLLATAPYFMVVNPAVLATSVQALVALAKSKPGQLNYGSAGSGSSPHLATELFKSMTGIDLAHVPYKGTTPALTDTMAGQVQLTILVAPLVLPAIKAGKVRALGVTSLKRTALAPDLPTISESVPNYEWIGWYGLVAPAGTPGEIIAKLNAEQIKALKTAEFTERLAGLGAEPLGTTPQEYASHLRTQLEKMRLAIKLSGARPD